MAQARHDGVEYKLVNYTEDAEWVLRDQSGDLHVFDADTTIEVQCSRCERWERRVMPLLGAEPSGEWACYRCVDDGGA